MVSIIFILIVSLDLNYFIFCRIDYVNKYYIPHLAQWISTKENDSNTNNLLESFNHYLKDVIFQKKKHNSLGFVVDKLSSLLQTKELLLVDSSVRVQSSSSSLMEAVAILFICSIDD